MKYKIYRESAPLAEPKRFFTLTESPEGLKLTAVDREGNWISNILRITEKGTIQLNTSVSEAAGLQLGDKRAVIVEKETY